MIQTITIVTGMPGSGKSTWVRNHMAKGDIAFDLDRIAGALTYSEEERENLSARRIAIELRPEMIEAILSEADGRNDLDCYIISTNPRKDMLDSIQAHLLDARVVLITTKFTDRNLPAGVEDGIQEHIVSFLDKCEEEKIPIYRIV